MEKDKELKSKIVETYAEDMAKVIESGGGEIVKKIIHKEEQNEEEKRNLSPESRKNRFFLYAGIVLLLAGAVLSSFFFLNKKNNTVPVAQQFTPIIFNDKTNFLEISGSTKDQITQTVSNEVFATTVKPGGIEGIYLTENQQVIGFKRFLALLQGNFAPDNNVVNDNFMMGVFNGPGLLNDQPSQPAFAQASASKDFFILLKVSSTADVFNSLRAWEGKMFSDLHGFFGVNISTDTNYLLTKNFTDGIIDNKNARILYDNNNNIVMMYIFADDTSVIITNTENAAHEIMLRLASSTIEQ